MKKTLTTALLLLVVHLHAQTEPSIKIVESYELANIILALTNYGIQDEWEVQKSTAYYKEVLDYFEPVKSHPLLDSVNYSREKWADYLSFRTDAVAFSFTKKGVLQRDFEYYTNEGHDPFDANLALVNDFVVKSGFRKFYLAHKEFYQGIIENYSTYNYLPETIAFLDKIAGNTQERSEITAYQVILSPLVYRMNCHRELKPGLEVDFPSASKDFIDGLVIDEVNDSRLNSNHNIFTEKDHGYVNPITSQFEDLVKANFNPEKWDTGSGYHGVNCFNEYMTWALYDLFLEENFPEYVAHLSLYWQYQNASRGFYAQNIFAKKVKELYKAKQNLSAIYKPLLQWTKAIENQLSQPIITSANAKDFATIDLEKDMVEITFSEPMDGEKPFGLKIGEVKENRFTGEQTFTKVNDGIWSEDGKKVQFKIKTAYSSFALVFNWWEINTPLVSVNGVFLKPQSYVLYTQSN